MTKAADPSAGLPAEGDKQARIAALRARYDALRADGQASGKFCRGNCRLCACGSARFPVGWCKYARVFRWGWYWFGRIERGTCVRLDNEQGTPGVACLLWNAADTSERFCARQTRFRVVDGERWPWSEIVLQHGRVLTSIIEDTCERHDVLLGVGRPREENESSPLNSRNGTRESCDNRGEARS